MTKLGSLRTRATIGVAIVFALALTTAGVALVWVTRTTMVANLDTALALRADDVASLLESGLAPVDLAVEDSEDGIVQVVRDGQVQASSANVSDQTPIIPPASATPATADVIADETAFRVVAEPVDTPTGPVTVIVGTTLEEVLETTRSTIASLAVGIPLLLVVSGLSTWVVVGRTLRPVETLRADVAEIGAHQLDRRVQPPDTQDEIQRLADTMNDMLDRIESGTTRLRQFVADASHELRSPIAVIRHELEVALANDATTDWSPVAREVLDEDLRLQRLVTDLLWLAQHDQQQPREHILVDLDDVAMREAIRLRAETGVRITTDAVAAGQVRGQVDDLARVVRNLLHNAARHARSRVSVSVASTNGRVVLTVDDDGQGVDPAMRDAIFERFTRSDDARNRDAGGAGLGLSIASDIAHDHHATLTVDDSPLGGARFTLDMADTRAADQQPTPGTHPRHAADTI